MKKRHYPCSENKGADPRLHYPCRENKGADPHLCFRIGKTLVLSWHGSINLSEILPFSHITPLYFAPQLQTGSTHLSTHRPLFLQSHPRQTFLDVALGHSSVTPSETLGTSFSLSCPLMMKLRTQPTKSCDDT